MIKNHFFKYNIFKLRRLILGPTINYFSTDIVNPSYNTVHHKVHTFAVVIINYKFQHSFIIIVGIRRLYIFVYFYLKINNWYNTIIRPAMIKNAKMGTRVPCDCVHYSTDATSCLKMTNTLSTNERFIF